jgi:hypothetical protein
MPPACGSRFAEDGAPELGANAVPVAGGIPGARGRDQRIDWFSVVWSGGRWTRGNTGRPRSDANAQGANAVNASAVKGSKGENFVSARWIYLTDRNLWEPLTCARSLGCHGPFRRVKQI